MKEMLISWIIGVIIFLLFHSMFIAVVCGVGSIGLTTSFFNNKKINKGNVL